MMLKQFLKDTSGNYAMMTALMVGPLVGALALSVDIAEMSRQRAQVMQTLDATNVATARYLLAGVPVDTTKSPEQQAAEREAKVKEYAKEFFKATLPSVNPAKVQLSTIVPKSAGDEGLKTIATLTYQPYFRPVALVLNGLTGSANIDLVQEAEVSLENTVELSLVLDNSGSMNETGTDSSKTRIVLLRDAAKKLVDRLAQRGSMMKQVVEPVRISLVPFAGAVNVGPTNANASWMDTQGKSPIHHENFNWPLTFTTNKKIQLDTDGLVKKIGSEWPAAERNQIVTRLTMFDELKVYKTSSTSGGTKSFTSWQGCVETRPYPLNVNDAPAVTTNSSSYFVPMFAVDEAGARLGPNEDQPTRTLTSLNTWLADDGGSGATAQSNMKKYFNIQASTIGTLGLNLSGAYTDYRGPNYSCTTTPITPLTDVTDATKKAALVTAIDAMQPLGATNVPEGMAWGWRTISSAEPFTGGRPEASEGNLKVMVVLTDGANTYYKADSLGGSDAASNISYYSAYGYTGKLYAGGDTRLFKSTTGVTKTHTNENYTSALNSHFSTLCTNAKAANVIVMTVALDLSTTNATEKKQIDALKACSSDARTRKDANGNPAKLFWNSTGGSLQKDFEQIADELSNLRITG